MLNRPKPSVKNHLLHSLLTSFLLAPGWIGLHYTHSLSAGRKEGYNQGEGKERRSSTTTQVQILKTVLESLNTDIDYENGYWIFLASIVNPEFNEKVRALGYMLTFKLPPLPYIPMSQCTS